MEIEIIAGMGALASALSKAQAAYPAIPRDREVEVQTRTGGKYKFKYAPLDTILNAVRGPLSENGLAVTQLIDGQELVTMLLHESGASLTSKMALPHGDGTAQALGSAITYLRRYSLQAMLGIAAEDDDDGKAGTAAGMTTTPRPQQQAPQRRSLADAVRERSGDALRAPAGPSAAPDAPGAPEGHGEAPGGHDAPAPAEDVTAEAAEVFSDVAAPGITMPEFKKMMKERHVLSGQITAIASRAMGYEGMVSDMSDADRFRLWNHVLDDLSKQ